MRRELSGDGLLMALLVVMAVLGLAGSIAGIIWGPEDQRGALAVLGGIAAVLLGLFAYTRLRPRERHAAAASGRVPRYVMAECFWGALLTFSLVGLVVVDGPSRAAWVVLTAVCSWQLVAWERRRRRADRDDDAAS